MKKLLTAIVASLIPVISFAQNNVQGSLYRVNNMGGPGIKRHYYRRNSESDMVVGGKDNYAIVKFLSTHAESDSTYSITLSIKCAAKDSMEVKILSRDYIGKHEPYKNSDGSYSDSFGYMPSNEIVLQSYHIAKSEDESCTVILKMKAKYKMMRNYFKEIGISVAFRRQEYTNYFNFNPATYALTLSESGGGGFMND